MSENLFEKSLEQYAQFQKDWSETAVKLAEQFDPKKYIEQMTEYQENVIKGINTLMNLNPEDTRSDQLEKDVMNVAYLILKPLTLTLDKYVNMVDKMADPKFLSNYLRMEKWTFDSPAQVGATLSQFIRDMYQDNKLIKGELELGGQKVDLKNIKNPVLVACADKDHLVPLSASEPLIDAIGSTDKEFKHFKTGHIGMYTSSRAETEYWPTIINWLKERPK